MSMIEGIGDEVVQFFSAVIIIALALLAWWSTNITEGPLIRTVLILERRSRNRTTTEVATPPPAVSENENGIDTGQGSVTEDILETDSVDLSADKDEGETVVVGTTTELSSTAEAAPASDQNAEVSDSANAPTFRNELTVLESNVVNRKDKQPMRANITSEFSSESAAQETAEIADQIRIRLKYLNDDQKLVDGRLQEPLGDFKRRHFSIELAADKLVRLIFNGQVLQSDNQTLQGYGLYDNCVVHCLVHTPRAGMNSARNTASSQQNNNGSNSNPNPPDWNLSTLLYTCLSIVLIVAWYCRYQYAQLFTISTTVALIALTCIFSVSLFSLHLPDQDGIPQ